MGGSNNCVIENVAVQAYAKGDVTRAIANVNGDGIDVDAAANNNKVLGCYVYGYYYGIAARSTGSGNIITGNTVEKCKVGISAWYGSAPPGEQENTIIANNVIRPDGGQGGANWWGLFPSVGIGVDKAFGVTIEGNYIGNTLGTNGDFAGIVCQFGDDSYSEWHQNGYNIIGNRIVMLNGHAGENSISTIWAMYFLGKSTSVATYQHGLNVQGNQIKVNQHSNSTTPVIYGRYLDNFNFSNNMFTGQFNSDFPIIDIRNSNMVDISSNHFPTSTKGDVINLNAVNGSRVTGNTLGAYGVSGGASRKFVLASNVKDLQVSNNHKYYSVQSSEGEFVLATGLDYFTAIGNHGNFGWNSILTWLNLSGLQIEGMTRAAACVVTWTGHGKQTGDRIKFAGITQAGWTALNGNEYTITYIGANTFSIPVNTSGYAGDYVPATDPGTYWFQEIGHNQITNRTQ
jgi:parallel beta-helix repeat protein